MWRCQVTEEAGPSVPHHLPRVLRVKRPVGNTRTATTLADSLTHYRGHHRDTIEIGTDGYQYNIAEAIRAHRQRQGNLAENPDTFAAQFFAGKSSGLNSSANLRLIPDRVGKVHFDRDLNLLRSSGN